jgi:hypothetical protein
VILSVKSSTKRKKTFFQEKGRPVVEIARNFHRLCQKDFPAAAKVKLQ